MSHKAGFVSIIGKPNAGKSTLMNALVGEKMSIITPKAQTTRHRILGIVNTDDYQIVFSDTPGIIKPHYALQETMMHQVEGSLVDADLVLLVTDINEKYDESDIFEKLQGSLAPLAVIINKIDQSDEETVKKKIEYWQEKLNPKAIFAVSALKEHNVLAVMNFVLDNLPEHPAYYEKDFLTDRNDRFFASEIIREKIFKIYEKEIPYSTEVIITGRHLGGTTAVTFGKGHKAEFKVINGHKISATVPDDATSARVRVMTSHGGAVSQHRFVVTEGGEKTN